MKNQTIVAAIYMGAGISGVAWGSVSPVDEAGQQAWIDRVIPLPKETRIPREQKVPATDIFIRIPPQAGEITRRAVVELRSLLGQTDAPTMKANANGLTIVLGLADADNNVNGIPLPDAQRLRTLPNREQAYLLRPTDNHTLVIAALDERGLYYGVQTLKQLVAPYRQGEQIVIPLATITDWPDMAERGTWNSGIRTPGFIPWLAELKLNFEHFSYPINLDPKAERCPPLPMALIKEAKSRAFHLMPHSPHYDFLWNTAWVKDATGQWTTVNNKKFYPKDMVGKGDSARNPVSVKNPQYEPAARCPCASSPSLQRCLSEWMVSAAKQGVSEVCMWLTEYQPCYCSCEKCLLPDGRIQQLLLETTATVKAIQTARQTYPALVVRILYTPGMRMPANYWSKTAYMDKNDSQRFLALIPDNAGVKVDKMYGNDPAFNTYAKSGHWMAVYDGNFLLGIDWIWHGAVPFRFNYAPDAVQRYMRDFVTRGYAAAYSASCVGNGDIEKHLCDYTLHMRAEWSWNSTGRAPRQFNRAWLTQHGYADIDKGMAWLDMILPLEQAAVVGARGLKDMTNAIRQHKVAPLGGMTAGAEQRLNASLASAEQAARLAEAMKAPDLLAESNYLKSMFETLLGVYRLSLVLAPGGNTTPTAVQAELAHTREAGERMNDAVDHLFDTWKDLPSPTKEEFAKKARGYVADQMETIVAAVKEATRE